MNERHILQTSVGVTLELFVNPANFQMRVEWHPQKPESKKKMKRVKQEYLPWRDEILHAMATRAGKRVVVMTEAANGQLVPKVFGPLA